ncbi:MAG: hypothetical protein GY867_11565 [bacterium]|nr:hypothetical protein [bacterium]
MSSRCISTFRRLCPCLSQVFVALLLLLTMTACSTTYRFAPEELPPQPDHNFDRAVRLARIVEVAFEPETFTGGDRASDAADRSSDPEPVGFRFDSAGAVLDPASDSISGVNTKGEAVTIHLDEVKLLRVHWTDAGHPYVSPISYLATCQTVVAGPVVPIKRGESHCWDVVDFDDEGGRFDTTTACIIGTSKRGNAVRINAQDLYYAEYSIRDWLRPTRIGLAISVIGFVALGVKTVFGP